MTFSNLLCAFIFLTGLVSYDALTIKPNVPKIAARLSNLNAIPDSSVLISMLQKAEQGQAKGEFFFFFFGGSGALTIGGNQIPKILKEYEAIKALGGGPTNGGEILECNFLATLGYPEPLRKKDIEQIIQNCPTVDKILAKGQKKTYMAKLGYVEKVAFDEVMASSNPLARFAVFEAIAGGGASTVASPEEFKLKIASWKESNGLEVFKSDLFKAALKKYSAFAVFAFLIALVLDLIVESGIDAFL